jgi:Lon protease-like protein
MSPSVEADHLAGLGLFPLRQVLFPGAKLALKIFEARYTDLITDCLRRQRPFGVVCLTQGDEVRGRSGAVAFASAGVLARIDAVDAEQPGLLRLACIGTHRFRLDAAAAQQPGGLWVADVRLLPDDPETVPDERFAPTVRALGQAIDKLQAQRSTPFAAPYRLDDAGWVANRWCELLPVPLAAKQRLMELDDPQLRLQLVHEYLLGQGVVGD